MKHAKLKIIFMAAMAAIFAFALVGCGVANPHYDCKVTFDYNISVWKCETKDNDDKVCGEVIFAMERPASCPKCKGEDIVEYTGDDVVSLKNENQYLQYLGLFEGSAIAGYPAKDSEALKLQTFAGYDFDGWYFAAETDAEGNPKKDADGRVLLGEKVNFATYRVSGDVTLYAKFGKRHSLTVLGRTEQGEELELRDSVSYLGSVGDVKNEPFGTDAAQAAKGTYTLVEYYEDKELTTPFSFPYTFGDEDKVIYAKFLAGKWMPVSTAEGFSSALENGENIYVRTDIDYEGETWTAYDYAGTILGNGHAIRNISYAQTSDKPNSSVALFGELGDTFKVQELTFENVVLEFTVNAMGSHQFSAFAKSISAGAVFQDFYYAATLNWKRGTGGSMASVTRYKICPEIPAGLDQTMFEVTINYLG